MTSRIDGKVSRLANEVAKRTTQRLGKQLDTVTERTSILEIAISPCSVC